MPAGNYFNAYLIKPTNKRTFIVRMYVYQMHLCARIHSLNNNSKLFCHLKDKKIELTNTKSIRCFCSDIQWDINTYTHMCFTYVCVYEFSWIKWNYFAATAAEQHVITRTNMHGWRQLEKNMWTRLLTVLTMIGEQVQNFPCTIYGK